MNKFVFRRKNQNSGRLYDLKVNTTTANILQHNGEIRVARKNKSFFAYPSGNRELKATIEAAASKQGMDRHLKIWPMLDVFGGIIADEVREAIEQCPAAFFDVTIPNCNVYYELGYAIGLEHPIGPVINASFSNAVTRIQREGILDGIGYETYQNSLRLSEILSNNPKNIIIQLYAKDINFRQPIFFLDTPVKTDFRNSIVSAIKSSGVFYRSFDPDETARFSTTQIITDVTSSAGIVIPLLNEHIIGYEQHNTRAALIAGLSHALGRPTLLLKLRSEQEIDPADYRDSIRQVSNPKDVVDLVRDFAHESIVAAQSIETQSSHSSSTALTSISLGAVAAENEFRTLGQYFLQTSEYTRTLRGEVKVVTGRKGSGKSAIFFQVRDQFRRDRGNLVIDLKPESYQLQEFRDQLGKLESGIFSHTITAFWQFVLLCEITVSIKKSSEKRASVSIEYLTTVERANKILGQYTIGESADFTTRLNRLSKYFIDEIKSNPELDLSSSVRKLTNIVFKNAIPDVRKFIIDHTQKDTNIVVLFDNIDKGWPASGVEKLDLKILVLLLEGLVKIGQDFGVHGRDFQSTVFLRNDIFELLLTEIPDRGKSGRVNIDWTDREKLRQVILKRLQASPGGDGLTFDQLWYSRFPRSVNNTDSFDFFIDHCLMRPRFLLTIIEMAIGHAINRGHTVVEEVDCFEAVKQHAYSLLDDFGFEIKDVSGIDEGILYGLVGCDQIISGENIVSRLIQSGLEQEKAENTLQLMLWYGLLGVVGRREEAIFIYDVEYKFKLLQAEMRQPEFKDFYKVHSALHIALK